MHRQIRSLGWRWAIPVLMASPALAQTPDAALQPPLVRWYEAAWARQPEAASAALRDQAAQARGAAAQAWTPEPLAMDASIKTDRFNAREGGREVEVGVAIPLWLPGERAASARLAAAERDANQSRTLAARLRTAGQVRDAWWQWQRVQAEAAAADDRLGSARALAADVARRMNAGDLSLADRHQADGAVAAALAAVAEAGAGVVAARQSLVALAGLSPDTPPMPDAAIEAEPLPAASTPTVADATHPALSELQRKADSARRAADLLGVQQRANPELTLATTRDRGSRNEASQQTVTLALRIPFGGGGRHEAKLAAAYAEALEAETLLAGESARVQSGIATARSRHSAALAQLQAADERLRLAQASRGFFQKSFALGETDLPTRLRIEQEAVDAERQALRARLELAASVSALRQAMGWLPGASSSAISDAAR
ncbi:MULTISPECIES: TolC family protein [unclassified Acidovorax]|uniref:TolC family protein n=1 Tax=unclassified Acidovorax TaxID=2684926 RepID=UPI0028834D6A|nr:MULTISPECIES: TolC family protein [unclassified Acidovorax]